MITTCTGCQARFRLDAEKVPHRKIRVRCPDCAAVFDLDGNLRDEPVTLAPAAGVGLDAPAAPEPAVTPAPSLGEVLQADASTSTPEPNGPESAISKPSFLDTNPEAACGRC